VVSELVTNALMASNDLAIARFPGRAIREGAARALVAGL
jgi:hypothetical protein